MQLKIDLHTHSTESHDGGITREQYKKIMHHGVLDYIAITDHNRIGLAVELHKEFGNRIIVGEEIMTSVGEIIGLYLEKPIKPRLSPLETVKQIKEQGGIVYIPHPFETIRKGIQSAVLEELLDYIDVIEICNGRSLFQNYTSQAVVWTRMHQKIGAASSDAHGVKGLGRTYSIINEIPDQENLVRLLDNSTIQTSLPTLRAVLYPKYHKIRKKISRKS